LGSSSSPLTLCWFRFPTLFEFFPPSRYEFAIRGTQLLPGGLFLNCVVERPSFDIYIFSIIPPGFFFFFFFFCWLTLSSWRLHAYSMNSSGRQEGAFPWIGTKQAATGARNCPPFFQKRRRHFSTLFFFPPIHRAPNRPHLGTGFSFQSYGMDSNPPPPPCGAMLVLLLSGCPFGCSSSFPFLVGFTPFLFSHNILPFPRSREKLW